MKKIMKLGGVMIAAWMLMLSGYGVSMAEEESVPVPIAISMGKITRVSKELNYVMVEKENGKSLSLTVSPETKITLNGQALTREQLSSLQVGDRVEVEHFINDAGMSETLRLTVTRH